MVRVWRGLCVVSSINVLLLGDKRLVRNVGVLAWENQVCEDIRASVEVQGGLGGLV